MSYALDSTQTNPRLRDTDYNHFVVFDAFNVIACHDFEVSISLLRESHIGDVCARPPKVLTFEESSHVTVCLLQSARPLILQDSASGTCEAHAR
jgi:hypothetical protein